MGRIEIKNNNTGRVCNIPAGDDFDEIEADSFGLIWDLHVASKPETWTEAYFHPIQQAMCQSRYLPE
jgi:hypothetical protein